MCSKAPYWKMAVMVAALLGVVVAPLRPTPAGAAVGGLPPAFQALNSALASGDIQQTLTAEASLNDFRLTPGVGTPTVSAVTAIRGAEARFPLASAATATAQYMAFSSTHLTGFPADVVSADPTTFGYNAAQRVAANADGLVTAMPHDVPVWVVTYHDQDEGGMGAPSQGPGIPAQPPPLYRNIHVLVDANVGLALFMWAMTAPIGDP